MGLGKTIMMIGTMLCNFVARTLIVVPPILLDQWYIQIYKTTGHKALVYHGAGKKTIGLEDLNKSKIVLTTYGAITLNKKQKEKNGNGLGVLHQVKWGRIIFDEAHHLRNRKTTRYAGAKLLQGEIRWLVSGTPVQNKKDDFYSLCSMIGLQASSYTESANLRQLASRHILKRTKKQVGIEMSDVVVSKNIVSWGNRQEMELSKRIHSALAFSRVLGKGNESLANESILSMLLRARQSCILPRLIKGYKGIPNTSSKLDSVVDSILERKGNGCGKLIFCHFRQEIDEVAARLRGGGMTRVATFDGRTSNTKRAEILSEGYEALILQIQTGCEGLNLQENYSEIYFISPHWNPAVEDQAVARCHRIGQTKPVLVQRFEMGNFGVEEGQEVETRTVDNYVDSVQENKRIIACECI
jgi:SNF2 family DNA or RNA helicase